MKHNFINYSKINKTLDEKLSKVLFVDNKNFKASEEDFKKLNFEFIPLEYQEQFAGKYRTIPLLAWEVKFIEAYKVPKLMKKMFDKKRETFAEILGFCIETISIIHPFVDWNRRTTWKYTNIWLKEKWYVQINWENFREDWEKNKYQENTDFLNFCLEQIYKEDKFKIKT